MCQPRDWCHHFISLLDLLGWGWLGNAKFSYTFLHACTWNAFCRLVHFTDIVNSGPFWFHRFSMFFTLRFGVTSTPKDTWQGFPSWSHELLQAMQEKTTTLETFDTVLGLHLANSTISRPFLCTSGDLQIASQTGTTLQRRIRSQFGIGL